LNIVAGGQESYLFKILNSTIIGGNKMKTTRKITNIGEVKLEEIVFSETSIGLYMPMIERSENIEKELNATEERFVEEFKKEFPRLKLEDCTVFRDVSLFMDLDSSQNIKDGDKKRVRYSVGIILWVNDETGREIKTEFYDPFEIDINDENSRHLKKIVMQKLSEFFF